MGKKMNETECDVKREREILSGKSGMDWSHMFGSLTREFTEDVEVSGGSGRSARGLE
jgi:hypothetical protein